jgi:hypothetical protein
MNAFIRVDNTAMAVGVVDLVALGLLVGCAHAAANPGKLRKLRKWAIGVAVAATVPFVGAVALVGHRVLHTLTRGEWALRLWDAYLVRDVVCSMIMLLLGAVVAGSPALVAALSTRRLRLATEQLDLDLRQLQRWAFIGGAPLATQLALATWLAGDGQVGYVITSLWRAEVFEAHLPAAIVAVFILLALPAAGVAAIALPVRAVTRSMHLRPAPAYKLTVPARFADCVPSPQLQNS